MEEKKPAAFPPSTEPDEGEDEEHIPSTSDPMVEREAERAIEEIEKEVEEEHPSKPAKPPPPHGPKASFIDRAWEAQYKVENRIKRIGHGRYGRVIKMARKPEPEEFRKASQITGLGIAFVGLVGFLIFLFVTFVMGLLGVE